MAVHTWFWAWLIVAAVCAAYELLGAEMLSLPFAFGALGAAVLELLGLRIEWQWVAFFAVTLATLVPLRRWWSPGQLAAPRIENDPASSS